MTAHTMNSAAAAAADDKETVCDEMTKEQQVETASKLFTEGKKALLSLEFAEASKNLADACQLYAKIYGEFALECADPNFNYGKALLELARMEPGVFGNALKDVDEEEDSEGEEEETTEEKTNGEAETKATEGAVVEENGQFEDPEKMTEEERQEVHEMVEDALEENAEALANGGVPDEPKTEENQPEQTKENGDATGEEETTAVEEEEEEKNGEEETTEKTNGATEEEEEDVSNLQLAWEVVDVARLIYEKQEGEEYKLKTAECHKVLGEVSIEDEIYDRAVDELTQCLQLQHKLMDAGDRRMAETYFQLGRALNLFNKFQEAADAYGSAIGVLKIKIDTIKEKCGAEADAEAKEKMEKELVELESLVPELQVRLDDCLGSAKSASEYANTEPKPETTNGSGDATDKKTSATSIDHLIRKPAKRQTEENNPEMLKKAKQDMNGHGDPHVHANGNGVEATNGTNGTNGSA